MRDAWNLNEAVSTQQYLAIFEDGERRELSTSESIPRRGESIMKMEGEMAKVKAVASPKRRRSAMKKVCVECHSKNFSNNALTQFDNVVELYNEKYGKPAQAIMTALYADNLLTPLPFDEPVEITFWRLWHDGGTRARHGAAMFSPSNTWAGMADVARVFYGQFLPQVRKIASHEKVEALIREHVKDSEHHEWLNHPDKFSPILGNKKPDSEKGSSNESE